MHDDSPNFPINILGRFDSFFQIFQINRLLTALLSVSITTCAGSAVVTQKTENLLRNQVFLVLKRVSPSDRTISLQGEKLYNVKRTWCSSHDTVYCRMTHKFYAGLETTSSI